MRSSKIIHIISCHAEGEVGDVIVGGVSLPPGENIWKQSRWIDKDQSLRRFVLNEPRGGVFRHVNLLVPPKNKKAEFGFIIMEPEQTPPMSGSNTICVSTVLLESGMIKMQEPETDFFLEAPAGLVHVKANCKNGKALSIKIQNVPSFAYKLDQKLEVPGIGTINVDTAYGGDSFVLVDAQTLGFAIIPDEARELAETGVKITAAANEQIGFKHPLNMDWNKIAFCQFTNPIELVNGVLNGRNTVAINPGKLDRSPCGTGCSARMAVMHERGEINVGDQFVASSVINSHFYCSILKSTKKGNFKSIIPSISGRGWITGTHQLMCDPEDPWPAGYRLSDTWPNFDRYNKNP